MIEIANWVANIFILGLGVILLAIGLMILLMVIFKYLDRTNDRD